MNLHAIPHRTERLVSPLDGFRLEPPDGVMEMSVGSRVEWVTITDMNGFRLYEGPASDVSDSTTFQIVWDARGIWSIS